MVAVSRNTQAPGPGNTALDNRGRTHNRAQRALRRPALRQPHPLQRERPSPTPNDLATELLPRERGPDLNPLDAPRVPPRGRGRNYSNE